MKNKCAWCQVDTDIKPRYQAGGLPDGECPCCGAWNDIGQKAITMNSMKQIYRGAVKLMESLAADFTEMLDTAGIDTSSIKEALGVPEEEPLAVNVNRYSIIKLLFLIHGSSGGTSTRNLMHRLDIDDGYEEFIIGEEDREECDDQMSSGGDRNGQ